MLPQHGATTPTGNAAFVSLLQFTDDETTVRPDSVEFEEKLGHERSDSTVVGFMVSEVDETVDGLQLVSRPLFGGLLPAISDCQNFLYRLPRIRTPA